MKKKIRKTWHYYLKSILVKTKPDKYIQPRVKNEIKQRITRQQHKIKIKSDNMRIEINKIM